jgi:hypothetical protein
MKQGKCSDDEKITAEHFFNAPLNLFKRLCLIFNAMLRHSFIPHQFRLGSLIPIVKDHQGNLGDCNNYRGITISPIVSKIFEHVLRILFHDHLTTSKWQFGYKKKSSTVHALFCLKETVNYYVQRGSNVYCSFLDASKAFDRLIHSGLFLKIMNRGVPLVFLDIMVSWYDGLYCRVRWGDHYSDWFLITAGVRQGGILSPDFYCIYVDDLVIKLSDLHVGCYIKYIFVASLLYADDMALLAPSLKGLQALLGTCEAYCLEWDICLNAKKSKNLYFGRRHSDLCNLVLNGNSLDWVDAWKYLGVTLVSHKQFNCSISDCIRKFYKCTNAIFRVDGRSNDLCMLQLIESHCIPILTYAVEIICVADSVERRKLRVAYNSIFRKIFGFRYFESVTELQLFLVRSTWEQLVERRTEKFLRNVSLLDRSSLITIFR